MRQHALDRRSSSTSVPSTEQGHAARAAALADGVGDADLVVAGRQRRRGRQLERVAGPGEGEVDAALGQVEGVAAEPVAQGEDDAVGPRPVGVDVGRHGEAAPQQRDRLVGDRATAGPEGPRRARRPGRRDEAAEAVDQAVGNGQHVVAFAPRHPTARVSCCTRSGSSSARSVASEKSTGEVEQLPAVVVEVAAADGQLLLVEDAGADVVGRRLPALVVDGARAQHLEVLGRGGARARRGRRGRRAGWRRRRAAGRRRRPASGTSRPTAARTVGIRSTAWANWGRTVAGLRDAARASAR